MVKGKYIQVGAILELQLDDGRRCTMEVAEIKDGKVTFKKPGAKRGGRWWLPYSYVKKVSVSWVRCPQTRKEVPH